MDYMDFEEWEDELAKIDPAELRKLFQLPPVVQNVLDEPISEETQKRLLPPLSPKPF